MCHGSSSEEEASTSQVSSVIDKQLKTEERKVQSQVKLLLLGSNPCPSTVFRETCTDTTDRCGRQWEINDPQGTI